MHMNRVGTLFRRLAHDTRAIAMSEFALAAPLFLTLGLAGVEAANFALVSMKVSQVAANLADTTSRIGQDNPLSLKRIRESDINDAFQAVRLQGANFNITTNGRVILSSLETNANKTQWIRWQRCVGKLNVNSSYGAADDGAVGKTVIQGMGPGGDEIKAPVGQAVMFVEIQYDYQPLITKRFFGSKRIKSTSAFIVRDPRDLSSGNNPSNPAPAATAASCSVYAV
jgi:Flp pilus assembly protein TadG